MRSTRLAIVVSHPTQYYSPWFKFIATKTALQLRVYYLWDFGVAEREDVKFGRTVQWDVDLLNGYDFEFVPNIADNPGTSSFEGLNNPTLPERLKAWRPDAVLVFGYGWRSLLKLALFRPNCPLILRGDPHLLGRRSAPAYREWIRGCGLRLLLRRYRAFACVGSANQAFYQNHGVPRNRCYFVPHCVDNLRFGTSHANAIAAWRARHHISASTSVFMFAGKFEPKKRPDLLWRAFEAAALSDSVLVYLGGGTMRKQLEKLASGGRSSVKFLPFHNQSEMPTALQAADILVLPSEGPGETWGLIVNEAMAAGTPAIVSDHVGCASDLIVEGRTGWVFPAGDQAALKHCLIKAKRALDARTVNFDPETRAHIRNYSYEAATAGLLEMLAAVVPAPSTCST